VVQRMATAVSVAAGTGARSSGTDERCKRASRPRGDPGGSADQPV